MNYDIIIIGGGASGLMAACALSRKGRRVALLEKQARVGRKLLSTGNGRCNLTNRSARPSDYHGSRQAVQHALRRYPPSKVEAVFAGLGIPTVADGEGRVYPMSRQAASVLDALRLCCAESGAEVMTDFAVTHLSRSREGFEARSAAGQSVRGRCALVCTGGLAAPKLGASGEGYRLLEGFGHHIAPRFPAIAALRTPAEPVRGLKGIRAEGDITLLAGGEAVRTERGELLFADAGISGIAAMQLARGVNEALRSGRACAVRLNLAPGGLSLADRAAAMPRRAMEDFLNGIVARRLGQALVKAAGIEQVRAAGSLSPRELARLEALLTGWVIPVVGTLDYDQAQVTAGGAMLSDFDLRTLQSLRQPGLFAAGEVLDVDGDCGGFNLQWAWSSALLAADGIEALLSEKFI